jgi:hypothetical protein
MQDFRNLEVWQKAHKLALARYSASENLSHPKYFNLRDHSPALPFLSRPISQKGVGRQATGSFGGSSECPWDRPANLSIISFSPATWARCPMPRTSVWRRLRWRLNEC